LLATISEIMHAADQAIVCILVGASKNRVAFFGYQEGEHQRFQIAGGGMPAGICIVVVPAVDSAHGFNVWIGFVQPCAVKEALGGIDYHPFIAVHLLVERRGQR
jgi:hypothetical protein